MGHIDLRRTAQQAEKGDKAAEKRLSDDRLRAFQDDARWRQVRIGMGADPYRKMVELYEAQGKDARDSDGIPVENVIHNATNDLIAAAVQTMPRCRIGVRPDFVNASTEGEEAELYKAARETEARWNLQIDQIMRDSSWDAVKEKVARQAGIMGVGYPGVWVDRTLDDKNDEVRRLAKKFEREGLTDAEWSRLSRLAQQVRVRHFQTPDVVWQQGVRSAYDPEMMRVSFYELVTTASAQDRYGRDDIRAGEGSYFIGSARRNDYSDDDRTGIVTTWEIHREKKESEKTQVFMGGGDAIRQVRRVLPRTSTVMVLTTVAGDKLVDVQVYDGDEGLVELPITPFYIREAQNDPYGICVPRMYEQRQDMRNRIRALIYKTALKSLTGQGGLIDARALPAGVTAEEMTEAMRNGEWKAVDMGEVPRLNLKDIFAPGSALVDGVAPALVQLYQMDISSENRSGEMVDMAALRSARSGEAKEAQIAVSDRPKTITLGHFAQGVEQVYLNACKAQKAVIGEDPLDLPVERAPQGVVRWNERRKVPVPVVDEAGRPVEPPIPMSRYPDGVVTRPFEVTYGDTRLSVYAQADNRQGLPHDLIGRAQVLDFMADGERYIKQQTAREQVLALDPALKAHDDAIREKEAEMMRRQVESEEAAALVENIPEEIRNMSPEEVRAQNAAMEEEIAALMANAPQGAPPPTP